jgi:hypothetical protein
MKKIISSIIFVSFILMATGCSFVYYPQTGSRVYAETNPENILIYSGDTDKKYEVLGSVAVEVPGDGEDAIRYLKRKAAGLGADAIIYVDIYLNTFESEKTGISGVAVKRIES